MWVNKAFWQKLTSDNAFLMEEMRRQTDLVAGLTAANTEIRAQKAKDDLTIDWMRHRINELTKHNAVLLAKAAGVHVPVPEIVPTRPGTMTVPDFSSMPSFEDVGDEEAQRLGAVHDESGSVIYTK